MDRLADVNLIDMDRRDLRHDDQRAVLRDQIQHRFGRADHRIERGDLQPQHDAGHRGADVQTGDLFGQNAAASGQFQRLVDHVAQLGVGIFAPGRLQLQDLQLDLGGAALGLGAAAVKFALVALKPCDLALQVDQAHRLGQPLVQQLLLVGNLGTDQGDLVGDGDGLGADALHLRGDLVHPLVQLADLGSDGFQPGGEQAALAFDHVGHIGPLGDKVQQLGAEHRLGQVIAFSLQPGAPRHAVEQLALDDGHFGFDLAAVQPDQQVARLDALRLGDVDFDHHPAVKVLHDLAVLLNLNDTGGDDGTVDVGQYRPGGKTADQQQNGQHAQDDRALR